MTINAKALATLIVERQMDRITKDGKGFVMTDMIEEVERHIAYAISQPVVVTAKITKSAVSIDTGGKVTHRWPDEVLAKVRVWHPHWLDDTTLVDRQIQCFNWKSTPQGFGWWSTQDGLSLAGKKPAPEAIDFLKALLDYRRRAGK